MIRLSERDGARLKLVAAFLVVCLLFGYLLVGQTYAQPAGASIVNNQTEEAALVPASSLSTAGGTFTTLVLNGSFQTQKWKAYLGNVSGIITLDDASNYTIYNWNLVSISGEVYVSRNGSVDWSGVDCAANSTIAAEETFLNINSSRPDSINMTFNYTIHRSFYVGTEFIANSTCRSIATFVNDTRQTVTEDAVFQEVLLEDAGSRLVYATVLENEVSGYDSEPYDFQLIVAEDETKTTPTPYYFYVEIS